ncbi:MAG: Serine hydroxymethyltransferase, partial [uncultured Acetobacteraceae bacterium]
ERNHARLQPRPLLRRFPGRSRPGHRRLHRPRAGPATRRDRADRVREHRVPRRAGGAGLRADEQVRRGLPRPALLRRLRIRGRGRNACDRARQDAVRLRLRQRAAALRRSGEPSRVPGAAPAGRRLHGPRPRGRRAPDPRLARQPVGQVVQAGALHGAARGPAHRHGGGGAHRAREPAEAHHRRGLRLRAPLGLSALPGDRRRGGRAVHGGHGALRRAGGGRRAPVALAARARRHHHDAQDAARAARRHDPHQRRGAGEEVQQRRLPRPPGRAADARDRRQGRGLRRGAAAGVPGLFPGDRGERARPGRGAARAGAGPRHRRDRQPPRAGGPAAEAPDRQGGRGRDEPRPPHLQQERHPLRPGEAVRHFGRPPRHAGRHHARLRRSGVPRGRAADRRGAGRAGPRERRRRGQHRRRGRGEGARPRTVRALPDLPGI